ncbi:MAG: 4Fe-4S binding protein, partial [Omnitrophica WOR_2 bacterium]
MAKKTKHNPYRLATQWIILFLLLYLVVRPYINRSYTSDFEAYCPFGGLQAFSSFLVSNSLACSMTTTQIFMGLGLVVAVILISKLFCSYICPIGSFTEWFSRMGRKLKVNFEIKGTADKLLRILKYGLLFLTFYFTITSSELFCKTFDPYYALFSGFSSDVVISYASLALLLAIPGSFFIRQAWCRYACPLGAASNILS